MSKTEPAKSSLINLSNRYLFLASVLVELDHAYKKHGDGGIAWSRHEFYGVLKEEVDEVWDAVKRDLPLEDLLKEVIQVAVVCLRYAETGSRSGVHDLPCRVRRDLALQDLANQIPSQRVRELELELRLARQEADSLASERFRERLQILMDEIAAWRETAEKRGWHVTSADSVSVAKFKTDQANALRGRLL